MYFISRSTLSRRGWRPLRQSLLRVVVVRASLLIVVHLPARHRRGSLLLCFLGDLLTFVAFVGSIVVPAALLSALLVLTAVAVPGAHASGDEGARWYALRSVCFEVEARCVQNADLRGGGMSRMRPVSRPKASPPDYPTASSRGRAQPPAVSVHGNGPDSNCGLVPTARGARRPGGNSAHACAACAASVSAQ